MFIYTRYLVWSIMDICYGYNKCINYKIQHNTIKELYKYTMDKVNSIKKDVNEIEDSCKCLDNYIDDI